ncbi:flavin reductase family protein [Treponema sp. C6A8]|uniref:flavin reductase family protein n=1 Tax=Treponema sp. C6A8 TaxID=1410609 RepID=UPI000485D3AD|nr:flavin reductase family protein [Treponema sp. C6A8]
MRSDCGAKEILFPMPVLIVGSYDENGKADAMNAAWGGIGDTKEVFLCLDASHKTVKNILKTKEFTVSPATLENVIPTDYVGIESANKVENKMEKSGLHVEKAKNVNAPVFAEFPVSLECRLKSYDEKTSHLFGEIVNVTADEAVLTEGKIDIAKLKPISYNPVAHTYHLVNAESCAQAFSCGAALK